MYKFPLAAVLNHRKFLEENLQKELGLLKKTLLDERNKFADINKAKNEFSRELHQKQIKSITIAETLLYVRFIEQLSWRLERQSERVSETEKNVGQKREDLIEAMKNRKTLENLEEKGRKAYKQNLMRKEQKMMNEMASVRF
ncbi:MAG: flagellar export protein FliJ, partial [Deltaproteobacteria bacterium]|nr:flagellar export protein FliJ [Deltaproteobacteria bacterium]